MSVDEENAESAKTCGVLGHASHFADQHRAQRGGIL